MLLITILLTATPPAQAQQAGKIFRIGFLDPSTASGMAGLVEAFQQELTKLGWIEGKNVIIEYRYAEHKLERLPELAVELVRLKVDLIVVPGVQPALAAKKATTTIPIVVANAPDPVGAGLVGSLARPGGNITGLASLGTELNTKRLDSACHISRLTAFRRSGRLKVIHARGGSLCNSNGSDMESSFVSKSFQQSAFSCLRPLSISRFV